jgi:PAS domain S-box-containing protein
MRIHIEETKALPEIEEHLRPVAATATEAIITIDDNGHIIFWNPAAKRMFGYSHDEIFGKPLILIIP